MNRKKNAAALLALFWSLLAAAQFANANALDKAFSRQSVIIEASGSGCYEFDVYLALSSRQQQRGLMHVRHLPPFTGMLFVHANDEVRSMWMKNTYIPLDMLFVRSDGTVASIAASTEPLSLESIASSEPVRYVLELNGGTATKLGIDTESRVYLPTMVQ